MERNQAGALALDVNGTTITVDLSPRWPRALKRALPVACAALAALAVLLVPEVAEAWPVIDDIGSALLSAVGGMLSDVSNGFINNALAFVNGLSPHNLATNGFTNLLGSGDVSLFTMITQIADVTVKPIAATVLSFVVLVQIIKISQRIDGNVTMPALREVLVLFFTFAIGMFLVRNSVEIMGAVYQIFLQFIQGITAGVRTIDINLQFDDLTDIVTLAGLLMSSLIVLLAGAICSLVANIMLIARAVQLYLYATFAPLMWSFIVLEDTRSWSIGYLKGFMSCCLSGFIIYFSLAAFPYAVASLMATDGSSVVTSTAVTVTVTGGDSVGWVVGIAAACFALALLSFKSGQYAREILGG